MAETAEATIRRHLMGCLPPDVPPSFRAILSARFEGTGRRRKAIGSMEMFDGQPATVEVFQWGPNAWGHRWTDMPGGACSWEGGRWRRCDAEGNLLPDQHSLDLPVWCERCQGNGEIVTDWDAYLGEGQPMTDAVAECPDCCGTGRG